MNNWVDTKDRLPEENTPVLVWNKDAVDIGFIRDRQWRDFSEVFRHVTYWMPLPEPPDWGGDGIDVKLLGGLVKTAELIVEDIIEDLAGRSGSLFHNEIDDEIAEDIRSTWIAIAKKYIMERES